jgi:hypothetical protein
MELTRLVGDIHGMFNDYRFYALGIGREHMGPPAERSIQIGDYGLGFGKPERDAFIAEWQTENPTHRFIRGNHDNPAVVKTMPGYIADGKVENDVMFIGGAWSIDNPDAPPGWYKRTKDVNWWEDEECSDEEFARILDTYKHAKPRVMITHDCPHEIAGTMFWGGGLLKGPRYPNRTGDFLQKLLEIHQPDEWYFGHWHYTMKYMHGKTMFQCIGELDHMDVML